MKRLCLQGAKNERAKQQKEDIEIYSVIKKIP